MLLTQLFQVFMWLTVSSFILHNVHLLFPCVLSIFSLTFFVLIELFYTAIQRNVVYLLKFLLLSYLSLLPCNFPSLSLEVYIQLFYFQLLFSRVFFCVIIYCQCCYWLICICHCLPPDRVWHKVNDPNYWMIASPQS